MSASTSPSSFPERVAERIVALHRRDPGYPGRLGDLAEPPALLWCIGDLAVLEGGIVAIVGTRRATPYGVRIARELGTELARAGACVASGMALGIDGVAHTAALDAGGRTCAVLGTGVDIAYPPSHRDLHARIAREGLLISEMPVGAHSHGGSFPKRNRIIAALADLTIVVEAPHRSGALITAKHAVELDRKVAAVMGPIDSPQSAGCNELIQSGAHPITGVADALALVGLTRPVRRAIAPDAPDESSVWTALQDGAADLDTLCHRAGLPVERCLCAVTALEMRGAIELSLTGEIRRR